MVTRKLWARSACIRPGMCFTSPIAVSLQNCDPPYRKTTKSLGLNPSIYVRVVMGDINANKTRPYLQGISKLGQIRKQPMIITIWGESEITGKWFQNLSLTFFSNPQVVQRMKWDNLCGYQLLVLIRAWKESLLHQRRRGKLLHLKYWFFSRSNITYY